MTILEIAELAPNCCVLLARSKHHDYEVSVHYVISNTAWPSTHYCDLQVGCQNACSKVDVYICNMMHKTMVDGLTTPCPENHLANSNQSRPSTHGTRAWYLRRAL